VGLIRQQYHDSSISKTTTELVMFLWREKSSKSYDSFFGKWTYPCTEQDRDIILGPTADADNFLAELFQDGYQSCSLSAYWSVLPSICKKVDGYSVLSTYHHQAS